MAGWLAAYTCYIVAGEVEFLEGQVLRRWNNLSGTYQCPDSMAFQAGLPLDKFHYVSHSKPAFLNNSEEYLESSKLWVQKGNNTYIHV